MRWKNELFPKLALAFAAGAALAGCDGGSTTATDLAAAADMAVGGADIAMVPGDMGPKPCPMGADATLGADITADKTLQGGCTYVLQGNPNNKNYLFVKNGATLTVEPGVTVRGRANSLLVITRGSRIMAVGTRDQPIVFTSDQPDDKKTASFWGGLLLLGRAPINNNKTATPPSNEATYEAFAADFADGMFGGTDPMDSSGKLKYVRVEFGGYSFIQGREFNTITFAGVGAGTEVDYVQAHAGSDDGFELFGGTVNVKHLVSSQNGDDGFDTDNGWQGKGQFIIVQNVNPQGASEASNGYESDNHATAFTAEPRTIPTLYNVTVIGRRDYTSMQGTSWAGVIRRGTGGRYYNHIVMNFQKGIEFRDAPTKDQLDAGNLFFKSSIFFNNDDNNGDNYPPAQMTNDIDEKTYFERQDWANQMGVDPGLEAAAVDLKAPSFKPKNGARCLTGGATPPDDGFYDKTATFIGAVGADDWTAGWTRYPQPAM